MKWNLPQGYCAGPLLPEHEPAVVDVLNTYWQWMNGGNFTTLEEMHAEWQEPNFNTATDTQIVFAPDGSPVGYTEMYNITTLHVRSYLFMAVLPEHMGRGIEEFLVQWTIDRARADLPKAPEGARVVLHAGANAACQPACDLLIRQGMQVVRNSYRMSIDFNQPPAAPVLPEGIHIRPMKPGQEEPLAIRTAFDAFRDHWGHIEQPFEEYQKRWMHHLENDPNYDPHCTSWHTMERKWPAYRCAIRRSRRPRIWPGWARWLCCARGVSADWDWPYCSIPSRNSTGAARVRPGWALTPRI
jgi:mycothiol synthase